MQFVLPILAAAALVGSTVIALPTLVVEWASRSSPPVLFHFPTEEPVLALTIDDGPSEATNEILDVLAEHDARATFFLIGENVEAKPEIVHRILAEGHELGHHMMKDRPSRAMEQDDFEARFREMDLILDRFGGTAFFRPGSGWYNDEMVGFAAEQGYITVLGSVYPFDATIPWTGFIAWYLRQHMGPGDIVVLHDGQQRGERTAEVLRRVLPELAERGLRVETLTGLSEQVQPR